MSERNRVHEPSPTQEHPLLRQVGPVEGLCKEIGYPFDLRMERFDLFMAFVGQLVAQVRERRELDICLAQHLGVEAPPNPADEVLSQAKIMLLASDRAAAIIYAEDLHDMAHLLNPDEAVPTNHLIDMLSSCASAVRFGLGGGSQGFGSRHAAAAASHVWERTYGVTRGDRYTGAWRHDWTRQKLTEAMISLLPENPETAREQESDAQ